MAAARGKRGSGAATGSPAHDASPLAPSLPPGSFLSAVRGRFDELCPIGDRPSGSFARPPRHLGRLSPGLARGADGIEGDFHLTADDEIVWPGRFDTGRTGDRKLLVGQATLAELRKVASVPSVAKISRQSEFPPWPRSSASCRPAKESSSRSKRARKSCPSLKRDLVRSPLEARSGDDQVSFTSR